MKEPVEKVPLVRFRNSYPKIHHFQLYPLPFLIQNNSNHPFIRRILDGVLHKAHQRFFKDLGIDDLMNILFPLHLEFNVPMTGFPFHIFEELFRKAVEGDGFRGEGMGLIEFLKPRLHL